MKRALVALLVLWTPFAFAADATLEQLLKAGHMKRAKAMADAALQKNPNDAAALIALARFQYALRDLDGAEKLARKGIAAAPNSSDAHVQLSRILADQAQKASVFRQLGLAHQVKAEMDKAAELDPKSVDAHTALMRYYLQAPGIAGGSKEKAKQQQAEIAKIDPAWGYITAAEIANDEKNTSALPDLYQKAHDANPNQYDTARSWCNNLAIQKRWDEAEKCSRELQKLDPGRVVAYSLLSFIYTNQLRWKDLDALLADAEKAVPDNLSPYFQVGSLITSGNGGGNDYARAERCLRKYLSQEPEPIATRHSRAHWWLGKTLEKEGKKAEAIAELQIAVQQEPDFKAAQDDLKRLK